ncbi:formylmethanofuran dehydrogenase subunit E region [Methanococcus vannielii SB]|uniref:Formylmethanofuran dehydrogenase subunit E region n=1 Tax=Methanococcus vannielii (strain ATCC 35089 / DSM 1224 / JCM 13029 / OCM 148 / SB) TaxID=406327 RepID=A6UNI5_METVS|nr:FmdE family protein [Methanococcus vannielii]ABR54057.1 formylmethanofuran dehydrogenase subunit E region [Methanococcus vannielii SB]
MDAYNKVVEFHGHECPGVTIGYRVSKYVEEHFERSEDEQLVAIVENNSCSVDAVQFMLGCTFGKGNLKFKDNGKHVYTFYSRENPEKALRIYLKYESFKPIQELNKKYNEGTLTKEEEVEMFERRKEATKNMLSLPDEELFDVKWVEIKEPKKARLYPSIKCQNCGESFMEIKGRTIDDKIVCKDCFEKLVH